MGRFRPIEVPAPCAINLTLTVHGRLIRRKVAPTRAVVPKVETPKAEIARAAGNNRVVRPSLSIRHRRVASGSRKFWQRPALPVAANAKSSSLRAVSKSIDEQ